VDKFEEAKVAIPNQINNNTQDCKFVADPPLGIIMFVSNPHDDVHHERPEGAAKDAEGTAADPSTATISSMDSVEVSPLLDPEAP